MPAPDLLKVPEDESRSWPLDQEKNACPRKLVGNFKSIATAIQAAFSSLAPGFQFQGRSSSMRLIL